MKHNPRLFFIVLSTLFLGIIAGHAIFMQSSIPPAKKNKLCRVIERKKNIFSTIVDGARLYLGGKYRSTWSEGVKPTKEQKKEQRHLFGYNLSIEHIKDNDPNITVNPRRPTLYLHGWGDIKNSAKLLKAYCDVLPGDIVSFRFRDSGVVIPKIRHSSMGQLNDVLPALYTLKWIKDTLKPEGIDIFGYSRGGATAINMIAVLNDKRCMYDDQLAKIGITASERKALLDLVQKGCIVLDCPLTDLNVSARHYFKDLAPHALHTLARVGKYDIAGMQAFNSANDLAGLHLNILIHYQHNDKTVSNANEAEFYRRLAQYNPKDTYVVLGDDGGHHHTHYALSKTIHTFKHKYGGSYDAVYDLHYKLYGAHASTCAAKLLQPGNRADACINSFHEWCYAHEPQKRRVNFLLFSIFV